MVSPFRIVIIVAASLALASCSSGSSVYNVEKTELNGPHSASLGDIERAIAKAGSRRGWTTKSVSPGLVTSTYSRGRRTAVVDIAFDTKSFSITYKDSRGYRYNGERIHGKYNARVKKLAASIRKEMRRIR